MVVRYVFRDTYGRHDKKSIHLRMDYHLHRFYKDVAAENKVTMTDLLRGILTYAAVQDLRIETDSGVIIVDKHKTGEYWYDPYRKNVTNS